MPKRNEFRKSVDVRLFDDVQWIRSVGSGLPPCMAHARTRVAKCFANGTTFCPRQMALAWGVTPVNIGLTHTMTETVSQATQIAKREGLAQKGDQIVVVAGVPFGKAGSTNSLRVAIVGDKSRPAKAPPEDS